MSIAVAIEAAILTLTFDNVAHRDDEHDDRNGGNLNYVHVSFLQLRRSLWRKKFRHALIWVKCPMIACIGKSP
jgi:hypothetical protein